MHTTDGYCTNFQANINTLLFKFLSWVETFTIKKLMNKIYNFKFITSLSLGAFHNDVTHLVGAGMAVLLQCLVAVWSWMEPTVRVIYSQFSFQSHGSLRFPKWVGWEKWLDIFYLLGLSLGITRFFIEYLIFW